MTDIFLFDTAICICCINECSNWADWRGDRFGNAFGNNGKASASYRRRDCSWNDGIIYYVLCRNVSFSEKGNYFSRTVTKSANNSNVVMAFKKKYNLLTKIS